MKLLDKYILKEFLHFFLPTCMTFVALYLIIDFFEKIRMFLSNQATVQQMAAYFIYSLPMIISLMLPASLLLATLLTFSYLSKFSEITAIKANGISLSRIAVPALTVAVVTTLFLFFFSELVAPHSIQKAEHILKVEVQGQQPQGFLKKDELWYRGDRAIYNFKLFDVEKNVLRGITINRMNPDFTLKMRIDAERAEWQNNQWIFFNLMITTFEDNALPVVAKYQKKIIALPEKPDDFKIIQKDAEKMGFFELRRYVNKIKREGYNVSRYLVDLHGKIAFPLICLFLIPIGMSFSMRSHRSGGVMQSVGLGILIGFSYWIVHAFCMSLGRSGILPPMLAAWSANLLFLSLAVYSFYRIRS